MLYKRGEIWWVKFQTNGVTIRRSARSKKRKTAEKFERELRQQIEDDLHNDRMGRSLKRSFGDALVKYLDSGQAPNSMISHIRAIRYHMEKVVLTKSVAAAAEMKYAMLADQLNPQTINRRLSVVRRVLNLAYSEWEWLKEPIGDKISILMMSEKEFERHVYLEPDEIATLLKHIKHEGVTKAIIGYCFTGLRESELLGLTPEKLKNGAIVLDTKTKSKKPRIVPIHPEIAWVFDPLPINCTYHALRYWFELARAKMGRKEIRIHDLRHTFASWLISNSNPSVPITVVRDILGHSNLSVTSRYTHLRNDQAKNAVNALPTDILVGTKMGTTK